jgi:hypothetical protein
LVRQEDGSGNANVIENGIIQTDKTE